MASSVNDLHARILELEESTWRALQTSGAALVPYITPDCIMQFPMGLKVSATSDPSVKDVLRSPAFVPWKSFQLLDVDVTAVGVDGAVISYLVRAMRPPALPEDARDVEYDALCSSVWRREGDGWKMCFHQQTMTT